jgi:D-glycero-alpha-D-manno-heptose-7-phosphate kinase
VRHPILREVLVRHWEGGPLELASVADAPPGTGLGSSGAYTVCTIAAVRAAAGVDSVPAELAEAACEIELGALGRTVGKQDQYAAAFGGVRAYTFNPDDTVDVRELDLPDAAVEALADRFLLFFTGRERSASELLSGQVSGTRAGDPQVRRALDRLRELAYETCAALEAGDLDRCGEVMNEHWEAKRLRAPGTVTGEMDDLRDLALRSGARGVVSLGAGGGGFVLVYTPDPDRTRAAMDAAAAPELTFGLDYDGCAVVRTPFR